MSVRIIILTTETPHHTYYIQRISREFEIVAILYEGLAQIPKFRVGPLFEEEEREFEERFFFQEVPNEVPGKIPIHRVGRVNDTGADGIIRSYGADVGLVFGCGKIKPHVFGTVQEGLVNVHRGISEDYRGLDSDLWAILNDDSENIGVTIHKVDQDFDTGDILRSARLRNTKHILVHQIRYYTTVLAAELTLDILREYSLTGTLAGSAQERGQYFSFMPLEQKRQAQESFNRSSSQIADDPSYNANMFCFRRKTQSQLCILLYHGVTDVSSRGIENYSVKHMPEAEFRRQMKYIIENCNLMSMDEVAEFCTKGRPFRPRSVAVTFDDAFENVYSIAFPILVEYGIPFTFYISTGFVESEKMLWVDEIEDCINRARCDRLEFPQFEEPIWIRSDQEKIEACRRIKSHCKEANIESKDALLCDLSEQAGVVPSVESSPNYRKVNWSQLRKMAGNARAIIGGHTHTHNVMARMDEVTLRQEVQLSIGLLKENLGVRVRHYSYTEGQETHYNGLVISRLQQDGVVCAPTAIAGLNPCGSDPFQLKRVMVGFMGIPFPFWDQTLEPEMLR